jgi:hypothetical protein
MKYLIILFIVFVLFSCTSFRVTNKEISKYNPYKKGDLLVYKDSKNTFDTIKVTKIKKGFGKDPLAFFPTTHGIKVYGEFISKKHEPNNPYRGKYEVLISGLSNSKDDLKLFLQFFLNIKDDKILSCSIYTEATDTVIIEVFNNTDFPKTTGYLKKIIWSSKKGFLKYEYEDGSYNELVAFIRKNKNIHIE